MFGGSFLVEPVQVGAVVGGLAVVPGVLVAGVAVRLHGRRRVVGGGVHGGRLVVGVLAAAAAAAVHVRVVGHERGRAHVVVGGGDGRRVAHAAPVGEHGIRAEVAAAVVTAVALALTFFWGKIVYLFIYLFIYCEVLNCSFELNVRLSVR